MPVIYINIGSNNGDRHALIGQAVAAVNSAFPDADVRCSAPVETEPWGFESEHKFLNLGVAIDAPRQETNPASLLRLLKCLQEIEKSIDPSPHRDSNGNYIDRAIDIDLIAVDEIIVRTPELTLPHPRMHLRDFVLIPMKELAPAWTHPELHITAAQLAATLDKRTD